MWCIWAGENTGTETQVAASSSRSAGVVVPPQQEQGAAGLRPITKVGRYKETDARDEVLWCEDGSVSWKQDAPPIFGIFCLHLCTVPGRGVTLSTACSFDNAACLLCIPSEHTEQNVPLFHPQRLHLLAR